MQQQQQPAEFGIGEARRVLGEVFAPWVLDLNLSIEGFDFAPPPGKAAALLNRQQAAGRAAGLPLPLPGDTLRGRAVSIGQIPTMQAILLGAHRRH